MADELLMHMRIAGGSAQTEVTAVAVMPNQASPCVQLMTLTVVVRRRIAPRKSGLLVMVVIVVYLKGQDRYARARIVGDISARRSALFRSERPLHRRFVGKIAFNNREIFGVGRGGPCGRDYVKSDPQCHETRKFRHQGQMHSEQMILEFLRLFRPVVEGNELMHDGDRASSDQYG